MITPGKQLRYWPAEGLEDSLKFTRSSQLGEAPYDVAIIGAGIVGCALAYKLSRYKLRILLLDKNYDVGEATSKGSSAIIHTGFDAPVDTLESTLVTRASREWPELSEKLKVPLEQCGALLLATDEEQHKQLDKVYQKALKNGVVDIRRLSAREARELEPNITENVLGGIHIPRESIADPFAAATAYAEIALANGVDILLGTEITGIEAGEDELKNLQTAFGETIAARIVVNVAGLGSEKLARLYHGEPFDTNPRRGQFLIFDKYSRSAINHILLPIPTAQTKGVLVIPTIFGNLIAGPTAEDFTHDDVTVTDTTRDQLQALLDGASNLYPGLKQQPVISTFAGVRSNCSQGSYWVRSHDGIQGILTVAGVRSTGFTSSPALAQHLINELAENFGLPLEENPEAIDSRPESAWPGWWKPPYRDLNKVQEDPAAGEIICTCEQISKADILRQLDSPLNPCTLDAIKRRTRAQMGRCQGFNCMVDIAQLIADHYKIPLETVTKRGPGSALMAADRTEG